MRYMKKEDIKNSNLVSRALKLQPAYDPFYVKSDRNFENGNFVNHEDCVLHFSPNQKILHYLLEWDPDALKEIRHEKEGSFNA